MASDDWVPAEEGQGGWAETAQDFARAGVNAATFGMSDRAIAALAAKAGGRSYDEELAKTVGQTEAGRERSPYASIAGDVAGSVALPGFGAARLSATAARALAPTAGRAAPVLGRALGYGVTGAGVGAAQGAGNTYTGNLPDYIENAALGGVLGGAFGAAGGAAFGPRPRVSAAVTPDAAELEAAKNVAYRTLEQHPAQYTPASFAQRADEATQALRRRNYIDAPATEGGSPNSFRTIGQMYDPPTAINPVTGARTHISPADIDFVRKGVTGDRIAGASPTDAGSARIVRNLIDDFVRNPPPGAAIPGTEHLAADAARVANRAHQMHAGFKRTEALEELIRNSERQAGSTHSGLNLRNELQKAVKSGLKEKSGSSKFSKAGYNADELAAFDRFSRGQGAVSRTLGYADKILGGGGGLGALATGGVVGHLGGKYFGDDPSTSTALGVGAAGLGLGLRLLGNRRATADINRLRDTIAQRNPLYRERAAAAGTMPGPGRPRAASAMRDAAALALLNQIQGPRRLDSDKRDIWE